MKKSIGIIIPSLKKYGGAERYMIELCRYIQHDYQITLYAPDINNDFLKEHGIGENVLKVRIHDAFSPEKEKYHVVLNTIIIANYWKQEIGNHDLYLCNTFPSHLINKRPMLWFPHEPMRAVYDLKYEGKVEKRGKEVSQNLHIYPKARYDDLKDKDFEAITDAIKLVDSSVIPDLTIANSRYCAQYIKDSLNINCDGFIYPGCDQNPYSNIKKDPNQFITVSQLWSHKRVNLLIESIKMVEESRLIVIGSGPEKENLLNTCKELDLMDRVFFLSGLKNSEVQTLLARSSAFLFSAIREPFGIVVLEAMAAGCPIISVNEGGFTEVIDKYNSFLCNPYPSEFADKMRIIQSNKELREKMSKKSIEYSKKYSWKKSSVALKLKIEKLLKKEKKNKNIIKKKSKKTQIGIQYYAWYGEGYSSYHWNDTIDTPVKVAPSMGYYGSTKGETIKRHMQMLISSNIDYIIVNLHIDASGINHTELMSLEHIASIIEQYNLNIKFSIQVVPSKNFSDLNKAFKTIRKVFFKRKNYLKIDDKPILYWFWSTEFDGNLNFFNLEAVTLARSECYNFAQSLRAPHEQSIEFLITKKFFDSFFFYSPLETANLLNLNNVLSKTCKLSEQYKYFSYTISPGYDDRIINQPFRSGNTLRHVPRNKGKTYEIGFKFLSKLKKKPNFITITTFNEHHEQTHIEPDSLNGDLYLKLTKKFIKKYCNV